MKKNEVRLTQLASAAGCGAKIGPKVLAQVVGKLPMMQQYTRLMMNWQ